MRLSLRTVILPMVAVLGAGGAPATAAPAARGFVLEETTVERIHHAFARGTLTCAELSPSRVAMLEDFLRSAGLDVVTSGDVRFHTECPDLSAAWTALLCSPQIMEAIRTAGVRVVRDAFRDAVAPIIAADGSVKLAKSIRFAVAKVPAG